MKYLLICAVLLFTSGLTAQEQKPKVEVKDKVHERAAELGFTIKNYGLEYAEWISPEAAKKEVAPALLLHLHGRGGERGGMLLESSVGGFMKYIEKNNLPVILIAPRLPIGEWNWGMYEKILGRVLNKIAEKHNIDPERVYIAGYSMGGFGTFGMIAEYPETFAAALPVCGGTYLPDAPKLVSTPIWAWHGTNDEAVPFFQSKAIIEAIKRTGGDKAKLTALEGKGHVVWPEVYANDEVLDWLFAQRRPTKKTSFFEPPEFKGTLVKFNGSWNTIPHTVLDCEYEIANAGENAARKWNGADDLSGSLAFAWTDDAILVSAKIRDDEVRTDVPVADIWKRDSLEIFIDPRPDGARNNKGWDDNCVQIIASPPSSERASAVISTNKKVKLDEIKANGALVEGGYNLTLEIPWSAIGVSKPLPEQKIGLAFCLNDSDAKDGDTAQPFSMSADGRFQFSWKNYRMGTWTFSDESMTVNAKTPRLDTVISFHIPRVIKNNDAKLNFTIDSVLFDKLDHIKVHSNLGLQNNVPVAIIKRDDFTRTEQGFYNYQEKPGVNIMSRPENGNLFFEFIGKDGKVSGSARREVVYVSHIKTIIDAINKRLDNTDFVELNKKDKIEAERAYNLINIREALEESSKSGDFIRIIQALYMYKEQDKETKK